ncbi:hypothetical protein PCASD_09489 [Puccinia coronata f. sp. avenae]|uniref:Uncharacterized protein n=1 Tax=Puccinia coronata f. sp. avenae TaxID=200324 RepID=A0A2N5UKD3_9BASI|nr:hypothetical protein PCASD_09489 [Puccinia coronata f. sp. avenae]
MTSEHSPFSCLASSPRTTEQSSGRPSSSSLTSKQILSSADSLPQTGERAFDGKVDPMPSENLKFEGRNTFSIFKLDVIASSVMTCWTES